MSALCVLCFFLEFGTDVFVSTVPDTPRVVRMMKEYIMHEFAGDEPAFERVVVYIRKSKVAPTPNENGAFFKDTGKPPRARR